jgi:hypothetical protein
MAKEYLKVKSLDSSISEFDIANGCHSIRFISFEAAIQMFREKYNLMELKHKPTGYRVTEQGIEIIQD